VALAIWPLEWAGGGYPDLITIRPAIWGWAVLSGALYYARASWCYTIGLKQLPASMVGLFLNLTPIFDVVAAYLFLGERLTVVQWIGGDMRPKNWVSPQWRDDCAGRRGDAALAGCHDHSIITSRTYTITHALGQRTSGTCVSPANNYELKRKYFLFRQYGRTITRIMGAKRMLDQQRRAALEQQQWSIDVNDVSPLPHQASLIELWKVYANGVAVRLSIQHEQGQFLVYADVGHASTGTNTIEYGRFSTRNAAVEQLIQECAHYDRAWET
jgi:hypothetical protein